MKYEIKDENGSVVDEGRLHDIPTEKIGYKSYQFDDQVKIKSGYILTIIPEMIHET